MQTFRLIQFSDMHLFGDATEQLRGVASLPALQAAVADAARRCHNPDAILLTGDLVQDDPNGYRWVRHVFGGSQVPVLCLSGNHDVPEHMRSTLDHAPFQVGGEAQFGKWLVVMLDTWVAGTAAGKVGSDALAHLREVLTTHRNKHVLVCLHHQPIAMRSEWLDHVGLQDADAFMSLVRQYSNVRGVIWGHVHQALDSFVQGVRFMATPATCAQFLPHSAEFAIDNRPPGYRVLELRPDGSIATEVVWLESYAKRSVA
jgi:3',5'-cyclic-AMP phosphodiesterase